MKGWNALPTVPFDFADAHNLGPELTDRASEATVKRALRQRFSNAKNVVVLIGQKTRNLYRYVRWELDVALELGLPIIAVNLNGTRAMDYDLCPPIIRDEYVVHIPFKLAIIKYALSHFPAQQALRLPGDRGPLHYPDSVYRDLDPLPVAVSPPPTRPVSPPPPRPDLGLSMPNFFSPPAPTLGGLLGQLAGSPLAPPPSVPPAYNVFASLQSLASVTPPAPGNLSLADLLNPYAKTLPGLFPWSKKLGD